MLTCPFCIGNFQNGALQIPTIQSKEGIGCRILECDGASYMAAGLGAIAYPYVLFIPRRHITGFINSNIEEQRSLIAMLDLCVRSGLFPSGTLSLFEHGGHGAGTCSCVDHCHIHIVDGRFDLMRLMIETKPESRRLPFCAGYDSNGLLTPYLWAGRFQSGVDYIEGAIHPAVGHGSQYFRRLLAAWIRSEEWDWRLYPRWDNIERLMMSWNSEPVLPAAPGLPLQPAKNKQHNS